MRNIEGIGQRVAGGPSERVGALCKMGERGLELVKSGGFLGVCAARRHGGQPRVLEGQRVARLSAAATRGRTGCETCSLWGSSSQRGGQFVRIERRRQEGRRIGEPCSGS